ncbi:MAG: T9SS type A sorting domain-containing protein [Owenweeksia sp.]|nr:T9SS type A sorting domain-containing protein [Owenweeksia sp.]
MTGVITSPYTITGLQPGTSYDVYVADTCANDTSNFVGPLSFTTTGATFSVSFTHTAGIAGPNNRNVFFDASASIGASNFKWDFGNGNTGTGQNTSHLYTANGSYQVKLTAGSNCKTDSVIDTVLVTGISLAEVPLDNSLEVYPNPASEVINISFSTPGQEAGIKLLDLSGKLVLQKRLTGIKDSYRGQLDLNALANGIYILEIESGDSRAHRRLNLQ